jgi:enoyl-CoA hydratase/carnithine racemase
MSEQSGTEVVLVEIVDRVCVITLNRPERRNAWTVDVQREYFAALEAAALDTAVVAIVLTGAGGSFCPGADTQALTVYGETGTTNPAAAEIVQPEWFPSLVRKPIIAAIEGPCAGVGLAHALMCDIRVAAEDARLSTAFARRSLPPMHGAAWLLERLVGAGVAQELLLTGRTFSGAEAVRLGVASEAVPSGGALARAMEIAADIAAHCSPSSLAAIKEQVWTNATRSFVAAVEEVDATLDDVLSSADFREGVASFVERRAPRFSGLDPARAISGSDA